MIGAEGAKRWGVSALLGVMMLLPTIALADDATMLGPQSSAPGSDSSAILQPNGGASDSLQSSNAVAGGVGQSQEQQLLQQPASQDQAKLFIQGDVDGGSQGGDEKSGSTSPLLYVFLGLVALSALVWQAVRFERRRSSK